MAGGSTYLISGAGLSGDALRSLRRWMLDVRNLSGPVDLRQADPQPGEMGSLTDALVVAAGSGGAITALAGALVSWLRHRTTDLTIKVTLPDGRTLEVDGNRVRGVDSDQLTVMIEKLAGQLGDTSAPIEARTAGEPGEIEPRG
jgi:membrane-associated two-gene conflict system component 1 (EACC1)